MPPDITSARNPRIAAAIQLRQRRQRDRTGLILVEGRREIALACQAGLTPREIFVSEDAAGAAEHNPVLARCRDAGAEVLTCATATFQKLAIRDTGESILGVFPAPKRTLDDLAVPETALIVIAEQIEKPGNLGAIIRTCDGAGVDAVLVSDPVTDIYNPNVIRASLGTVFTQSVIAAGNIETSDWLGRQGFRVIAASPDAKQDYTSLEYTGNTAIVFGSEAAGLSNYWTEQTAELARIPMKGSADSLNVSATAAVVLYEAIRQRAL